MGELVGSIAATDVEATFAAMTEGMDITGAEANRTAVAHRAGQCVLTELSSEEQQAENTADWQEWRRATGDIDSLQYADGLFYRGQN